MSDKIDKIVISIDNLKYYNDEINKRKQDVLISGHNIKTINGESILGEGDIKYILPLTYSELFTLRNNNQLIPGQQYRVTDYATTTIQQNTQSAGHPFDIIVTADDESTLNEVARAIQHDGDTYFADSDLNSWQIWYCLDNDINRFAWADTTNGKGVIYRMIDEHGNDCPYDFKNIQFIHPKDTTTYPDYYYTFSTVIEGAITDHSMLQDYCYGNTMKEFININKQYLNRNVFLNISKTSRCSNNSFGTDCYNNSFENSCSSNSFENSCSSNSFKYGCSRNSFGNNCSNNSFREYCHSNSFGNECSYNSFGYNYQFNSFGNNCNENTFENSCSSNSFENGCSYNSFGDSCSYNSFGNECSYNSFRVSGNISSLLKDFVQYNHFDDGCSYNVIWNSNTTSSSRPLKNINVNRGVVGTSSSYNFINISATNSEQEIAVNQVDKIISIGNILSIKYETLKVLRNSGQLIPGRQYRIIDYVTTTSRENTQSTGHQFDVLVLATSENTLSEEARAVLHDGDTYFSENGANLDAWKLWYCLDNDTNRFAWAEDKIPTSEITKTTSYDSSECTINSELIDGYSFITPFNFTSCVWVDSMMENYRFDSNHDINELVYEWDHIDDENGNGQLCLYKSRADIYEEEGQPDYGDKYLYRGVVNVDGEEYDYWQKWDNSSASINIGGSGSYVYATTPRIVSNPEALETFIQLDPKGVIYRMIDEFGNDCPYDFKNIQFRHPKDTTTYPDFYYTFSTVIDGAVTDHSMLQGYCYDNTMKEYITSNKQLLNNNVFLNMSKTSNCRSNSFGTNCNNNSFGNGCSYNSFGNGCSYNSFGNDCYENSFGQSCSSNSFGNWCYYNSFGNDCIHNSFRVSIYSSSALKDYVQYNHFDDGCSLNIIWNSDTTSSSIMLKNINVNRGVIGIGSYHNTINIDVLNQDYEIQVAKNSKGEIKIYCEADLIA